MDYSESSESSESSEPSDLPVTARQQRARVRVKNGRGEWTDLSASRPASDDPELEALWDMQLDELEKVLDDDQHPLHEKAIAVTAQALSPIANVLGDWARQQGDLVPSLGESFKAMVPNIDRSWISNLVTEYPEWRAFKESLPKPLATRATSGGTLNLDSPDVPPITLGELAEAAPTLATDIAEDQLEILRGLLTTARNEASRNAERATTAETSGRDALEVARSAKRAGWTAAWAAIAAALIAAIGIIVTLSITPGG